jgi:hypothetical protein
MSPIRSEVSMAALGIKKSTPVRRTLRLKNGRTFAAVNVQPSRRVTVQAAANAGELRAAARCGKIPRTAAEPVDDNQPERQPEFFLQRFEMRKFLEYGMDRYLSGRGQERLKERPLLTLEDRQYYVFYQKGAVVVYYMKEMIGEEAVSRTLRKLIRQYAYASSPYPTSYALVDALREETPPNCNI